MRILAGLTLGALGAAVLVGCSSSSPHNVSFDAISGNLTPELQGLTDRPVDNQRNVAVTNNQNWRMMSDDLGRVFYTDHPSRLSPYPITYTSGNPR